ncbi:hypothetical protein [Nocardia alba]|nr:hypothetical protein [Nocardia alba]
MAGQKDGRGSSPWVRTDRMRGRILARTAAALLTAAVLWGLGQVNDHSSIEFGKTEQGHSVQVIWKT